MSRSGPAAPPEPLRRAPKAAALPLSPAEVAPHLASYLFPSAPGRPVTGLILAVSGGPDSVALMRFGARVRAEDESVPLTVATVDHGLRPESAGEARQVEAWARACALPHRTLAWGGPKPGTGLQERARRARYQLLTALAREVGASHVLTAHTLDDQAETVLMRLVRGSGIDGLAAMRTESARDGLTLARPLLGFSKARLVATCDAEGWPYLADPSNEDPRFARARLRRIMPLLAQEGLTAERLATLARRAAAAEDALAARAENVLLAAGLVRGEGLLEIDGAVLAAEPDAVLLRVAARAVAEVARPSARPVRLERWEARVVGDLRPALDAGRAFRMTLGGALFELRPDRRLVLRRERRGGRSSAAIRR